MNRSNTEQDFWHKVDRTGDCWLWRGRIARGGYGHFDFEHRAQYAHRLAYRFAIGGIADGLDILHSCDNPACVNPAHLRAGTHTENMHDMETRGRARKLRGNDHPRAKLTANQAQDIRTRYGAGGVMLREIAADYGVHLSLISLIVRNKIWKDVP